MAVLYIAEFSQLMPTPGGTGQAPRTPPIAEQTVAIGGASAASGAFNTATNFVRVHTDAICSIAFGASPVATTAQMRLAAGQTEYFGVNAGDKIAVISNT